MCRNCIEAPSYSFARCSCNRSNFNRISVGTDETSWHRKKKKNSTFLVHTFDNADRILHVKSN